MNIQDRIANLEKELAQLKEEVSEEKVDESWKPRVGEIVEMSDDGHYWLLRRYEDDDDFGFMDTFGESFEMCRPLNDPMVIQLIPHVPGDPKPYGDSNEVIVVFKSGHYDASNPRDFNWDDDNDEYNIVGWFDIT